MRIEFKPQSLLRSLVSEKFSHNKVTRIIETDKGKIIELTYKKSEVMPTQWFVQNYNVMKRNGDGRVTKNFQSLSNTNNNKKIVIQNFYDKTMQETTIKIQNGIINKTKRFNSI